MTTNSPFMPRDWYAQRIEALEAQLRRDRDQFAFYATNHTEKATKLELQAAPVPTDLIHETRVKAQVNTQLAVTITELLGDGGVSAKLTDYPTDSAMVRARQLPITPGLIATLDADDPMVMVQGFHELYDVPVYRPTLRNTDDGFNHMTNARVAMRVGLVIEELLELLSDGLSVRAELVLFNPATGERIDYTQDALVAHLDHYESRNGVELMDALGDIVYVCYGFALEAGYDLGVVLREIHASNLTKLGENGKPIMRDDGKVLKGPNYMQPQIASVLGIVYDS